MLCFSICGSFTTKGKSCFPVLVTMENTEASKLIEILNNRLKCIMEITLFFFSWRKRIVTLNNYIQPIVLFESFFWIECSPWRCSKNELLLLCLSGISWFLKETCLTLVRVALFKGWWKSSTMQPFWTNEITEDFMPWAWHTSFKNGIW